MNAMSLTAAVLPVSLLLVSCVQSGVAVENASTPGGDALELVGAWRVEDIDRGGVVDDAMVSIEFAANGRVQGRGGCNRYSGGYSRKHDVVIVGDIVSTKMACAPALMDLEQKLFNRLEGELSAAMAADGALVLRDDEGLVLLRRMDNE